MKLGRFGYLSRHHGRLDGSDPVGSGDFPFRHLQCGHGDYPCDRGCDGGGATFAEQRIAHWKPLKCGRLRGVRGWLFLV